MELDFARQADLIWALLPEIVLSVTGMVVLLAGVWNRNKPGSQDPVWLGGLALGGILLTGAVNGWLYGVQEVGSEGIIALDSFRLFANWLFLLGAALTIVVSFDYVERQRLQVGEFYALILFATVGMMFMGGARDLILIFLGLETMSVAAYVLTAYNRRSRQSAEAGLKYFILGAFSTGFLLYGIALAYGATGTTNVAQMAASIEAGAGLSGLLLVSIGLLAVGFAFKVGAVPFHMWTPDVYEGAPSPATAYMAAAVKAASFVAFARVFLVAFEGVYTSWFPILWWLAALTMVVANLVALTQANVKRMLAYSSIAHGGYLLVAVAAANQMATAGLLFYLLVYTFMTIGAFGVLMIVSRQSEDRLQLEDYSGLGWQQPALGVVFTIFLLSLAGFPGTGGFMGKIYLLQGAVEAHLWTLAVILVLTTVLSYFYYLRVSWYMWMRPAPEGQQEDGEGGPPVPPLTMKSALVATAGILLFLGIFPGGILEFALNSTEGLFPTGPELLGSETGP